MACLRALPLVVLVAACANGSSDRQGLGSDGGGNPDATSLPDAMSIGDRADASIILPVYDAAPAPIDAAPPPPDAAPGAPDATPCTDTVVNVLNNGNFDGGSGGGWMETSSGGFNLVVNQSEPGVTANTQPFLAWLSGYDDATDSLYQDVLIPDDATMVSVRGYRWTVTSEDPGALGFDVSQIDIADGSGNSLEGLAEWTNQDATSTWTAFNLPVTGSYQGQIVRLRLRSDTDLSLSTHFLYDSLQLRLTTCQ